MRSEAPSERRVGTHAYAAEAAAAPPSPALAAAARPGNPPALSLGAVNGWRGLGAIGIALGHFGIATDVVGPGRLEPLRQIVDMFFVFSGFVIAQAYGHKLRRPSAFPEYVIRRFGRIWPLQAATLAVLVAYELVKLLVATWSGRTFSSPPFSGNGIDILAAIPTNLLLVQSLGIHDRETWNFPSWSLSVEFATYVMYAAFCLLRPVPRRILTVGAIAASTAVLVFVAPYGMRSTFDYGIFRCLVGFLVGTLCYDVATRWRLPSVPLPTLMEAAMVGLLGGWMILSAGTGAAVAAPLVFSLLIVVFAAGRGAISRALLTRPAQVLAEWSFAIYMTHAIVLTLLLAAAHALAKVGGDRLFVTIVNPLIGHPGAHPLIEVLHLPGAAATCGVAVVYLTAVLAASYAAYRVVEVPGRAAFARIGRRFGPKPFTGTGGTREAWDTAIGPCR